MENLKDLQVIKEQLFDAPADVKLAYNDVVEYFAFDRLKSAVKGVKKNYHLEQLQEKINTLTEKIAKAQEFKDKAQAELDKLKEEKAEVQKEKQKESKKKVL